MLSSWNAAGDQQMSGWMDLMESSDFREGGLEQI